MVEQLKGNLQLELMREWIAQRRLLNSSGQQIGGYRVRWYPRAMRLPSTGDEVGIA
jgi:hypothetical protein